MFVEDEHALWHHRDDVVIEEFEVVVRSLVVVVTMAVMDVAVVAVGVVIVNLGLRLWFASSSLRLPVSFAGTVIIVIVILVILSSFPAYTFLGECNRRNYRVVIYWIFLAF